VCAFGGGGGRVGGLATKRSGKAERQTKKGKEMPGGGGPLTIAADKGDVGSTVTLQRTWATGSGGSV
jgi:hypothetical protein